MKKDLSLILVGCICASLLTGCGDRGPIDTNTLVKPTPNISIEQNIQASVSQDIQEENKEDESTNFITIKEVGFNSFESGLINYLNQEKSFENYMMSPLSLKYALSLAIAGADNETLTELLKANGYDSLDELLEWTDSINSQVDIFDKDLQREIDEFNKWMSEYSDTPPFRALSVENSIWHNIDKNGTLNKDYINLVKEKFNAIAENVHGNELQDSVNSWVNDKTEGMIPQLLSSPVDDVNTILVNTLYLKDSWINSFEEYATKEKEFTDINGNITTKELMHQQESFRYYEDDNSKLVVLPMNGNINVAFVLGDNSNILDKINESKYENTIVEIPKFELESSFDQKEMVNYLKSIGVELAFDPIDKADFSKMMSDNYLYIDDIIQKTKIKIDEKGLEAAAATAILMKDNAIMINPVEPKEFIANKPFSFYIYSDIDSNNLELLFYGQIVK